MRSPYTQLYLHCVWATWDRLPLIVPEFEERLYSALAAKCVELSCGALAIGGVADHVHVLLRLSATIAVADIVKELKGSTSHLVTHTLQPGVFFRWQGAYGAFTVSKSGVKSVVDYIRTQKAHHAAGELVAEWETWDDTTPK